MKLRTACLWSIFWFLCAVAFGVGVATWFGPAKGIEFATGYLVEQMLSIDNLFVIMLVFARFQIPREHQRRVLTWGIVGVVLLRGIMIVTGTALVSTFHFLTYALGAVLLYTAFKLARERDSEQSDGPQLPRVRALLQRVMPITSELAGSRFTIVENGVRHATPLLLALVTIEVADAIFALDSVPAVLGVTTDPFIVFTSNLFAVLGLRSLYFVLSRLLERLRYLKHGLIGVLGIIGTKMLLGIVWPTPVWLSLLLVLLVLAGAIVASLFANVTIEEKHAAEQS